MIGRLVFAMALLLGSGLGQNPNIQGENTVGVLCGTLRYADQLYSGGVRVHGSFGTGPIAEVRLGLYRWEKRTRCCSKKALVAQTVTGKAGGFAFEDVKPGAYWLSGRRNLSRFKLAINYDPNPHTGDSCSNLVYEVRDGELTLGRAITLY